MIIKPDMLFALVLGALLFSLTINVALLMERGYLVARAAYFAAKHAKLRASMERNNVHAIDGEQAANFMRQIFGSSDDGDNSEQPDDCPCPVCAARRAAQKTQERKNEIDSRQAQQQERERIERERNNPDNPGKSSHLN